jgi:GTP cyclohydrolase I
MTILAPAVPLRPRVDAEAARAAVADLLCALGRDSRDPLLARTPHRVAETLEALLTPPPVPTAVLPNPDRVDDLVLVTGIRFSSICVHHLLPFTGTARIGYLPGEHLLGLSDLARGLEAFARDLQLQERLTAQVADWLERTVRPRGAGVVLEAEHLCMSLRETSTAGAVTRTVALRGALARSQALQDRFLR